jgi:hypothetical protein
MDAHAIAEGSAATAEGGKLVPLHSDYDSFKMSG